MQVQCLITQRAPILMSKKAYPKSLVFIISLVGQPTSHFNPVLQMRKLRFTEAKLFYQWNLSVQYCILNSQNIVCVQKKKKVSA